MALDLLRTPAQLNNSDTLNVSKQAPSFIRANSSWSLPWPLSLIVATDKPDTWAAYENILYSCLKTGDIASAKQCLDRIKERFGETNERVMGLTGLFHEAAASDQGAGPDKAALENILKNYDEAIEEKPTNLVLRKRRVTLLRSLGRIKDATEDLVELLDISPTDAEAWAELSDIYFVQGLYAQSIYSLEEVLTVTPNAWNIHARLGEVIYISAASDSNATKATLAKGLTRSLKCFCRSIELCDDYLRGYFGLKLTTNKLKQSGDAPSKLKELQDDEFTPLPLEKVERLNVLATQKLAELIRRSSTQESGWEGYQESEIIAARALLDQDQSIAR